MRLRAAMPPPRSSGRSLVNELVGANEGSWFTVPLDDGGYAVGRVVRMTAGVPGTRVILAYFFGPRREEPASLRSLAEECAGEPVFISITIEVPIGTGAWPLIGETTDWDRERWPFPAFGFRDAITRRYLRREHEDFSPFGPYRLTEISEAEYRDLPDDILRHPESVVARLTALLDPARPGSGG
jgi:hypothetical protein